MINSNEDISLKILAYLLNNPNAQDTLEGISEWWLLDQDIKNELTRIKRAVAKLVTDGYILEREGRDSQIHYRVNRTKQKQISMTLKFFPSSVVLLAMTHP